MVRDIWMFPSLIPKQKSYRTLKPRAKPPSAVRKQRWGNTGVELLVSFSQKLWPNRGVPSCCGWVFSSCACCDFYLLLPGLTSLPFSLPFSVRAPDWRGLSRWEHLLLPQGTRVWFPAPKSSGSWHLLIITLVPGGPIPSLGHGGHLQTCVSTHTETHIIPIHK